MLMSGTETAHGVENAVLTVTEAAALWDVEPGYLNTSSYGPPPRPAWEALQRSLEDWRGGRTSWEPWADTVSVARNEFAALVAVDPSTVATGAAVSQLLAPVAAAVPDGSRVLVPDVEFTSNVFPWAVHADRGVTVVTAPADRLADAVGRDIDVVAFSAVQSATGEVADLAAISSAARDAGALTVIDTSQAIGWLPVDADAADLQVCTAYKWLCSPRGTAFLVHHPSLRRATPRYHVPAQAPCCRLVRGRGAARVVLRATVAARPDARRFDISPAWHCWVGTAPALQVLAATGAAAIGEHNIALANSFLTALDQPPSNSAIVSVPASDAAVSRLTAAGVRFGVRAGRVRVAFHLYSTPDDVDMAIGALKWADRG